MLLTQRLPGKHLAGRWEFPGGKIEPGESPEGALSRELAEEIGVAPEIGALAGAVTHAYPDFDLLMLLYHFTFDGEPESRQVAACGWFTPGEITRLDMPPADAPLVERLPELLGHG